MYLLHIEIIWGKSIINKVYNKGGPPVSKKEKWEEEKSEFNSKLAS